MKTAGELDQFYGRDDPWDYDSTPDDQIRKQRLKALLPSGPFQRTLDIGCGNGFVTFDLPGTEVLGVDLASRAIEAAKRRAGEDNRFMFLVKSLFDLDPSELGKFDLIIVTGVLYKEYIGDSIALIHQIVDNLLVPGGYVISCHIDKWISSRFPYTLLDASFYSYRQYTHRLEVHRK